MPTPSFEVEKRPGLVIAERDGATLKADAYLPVGPSAPRPAFVLLHGGAFTKGSRSSYARWGRFLAAHGYVGLASDYRLATNERPSYPAAIGDAFAAVEYLRSYAGELRVDPERIGVMGGSAGGYLAAMLTLVGAGPGADPSGRPTVAVPMAGTFDMLARWDHDRVSRPSEERTAQAFLGGSPFSDRARWYEASPIFHASEANAKGTRWLIAWGTEDDTTPPAQHSIPFARALEQAGALVRRVPIVGAPHYWYMEGEVDASNPFAELMGRRLLSFLETWCGWGPDVSSPPGAGTRASGD
jgi:acetyl esterase/lipase